MYNNMDYDELLKSFKFNNRKNSSKTTYQFYQQEETLVGCKTSSVPIIKKYLERKWREARSVCVDIKIIEVK